MREEDVLLRALESSDAARASEEVRKKLQTGGDVWKIHESIFPVVQRVLNPPFINPHLPKMYRICGELKPYLRAEELPALIQLEINEYARRPKLKELPWAEVKNARVSFQEIESAIRDQNPEKTAVLMAAFHGQAGEKELARRLLLLGSGYLDESLGHSVSCTAFILLEIFERIARDPWPAIATLADYFCRGRFHNTPNFQRSPMVSSEGALEHQVLRAASGEGIVNLHHTITFYAMERVRHLFNREEFDHMLGSWISFMAEKETEQIESQIQKGASASDYPGFYEIFSERDAGSTVACSIGMIVSTKGRQQLGRFLIKGLCDQYQGNYNPHYISGLGAALFILDRFRNQRPIVINTLFQYLSFFFNALESPT